MSSRLDPSEYDLGELRAAVRWARLDSSAAGDARASSRPEDDDPTGSVRADGPRADEPSTDRGSSRAEASARESGSHGARGRGTDPSRWSRGVAGSGSGSWRRPADRRSTWPLTRYDHVSGTASGTAGGRSDEGTDDGALLGTNSPPADVDLLARLSNDVDRPYLERLPDGYGTQRWVLAWLEGLLATAGREGAEEALAHYEALGWLSTACREHLEEFLTGLEVPEPDASVRLTPAHHRESLRFVAVLSQGSGASGHPGEDR